MILGGSYLQLEFIKSVNLLKYDFKVIDQNQHCYSSKYFKHNLVIIDFSDFNRILKYAKLYKPDAIFSPANEIGNIIASKLSKKLNLKYNDPNVVLDTNDKALQRMKIKSSDLHSPKFQNGIKCSDFDLDQYTFPVVIKPSNRSASRGVKLINNKSEFIESFNYTKLYLNQNSTVIVEEYISGEQFSIETITINGDHYIVGITKEYLNGPPYFLERNHLMGPDLFSEKIDVFQSYVNQLLSIFAVRTGPCHIEIIISNNIIYLVELASRSGGWRDKLLEISGAMNYNELIIRNGMGEKIPSNIFPYPPKNYGLVCIMFNKDDIYIYNRAKKEGILNDYHFFDKEPEKNPTSLIDAIGYIYLSSTKTLEKYLF